MTDSEIINPGIPVAGPYSPGIKAGNTNATHDKHREGNA